MVLAGCIILLICWLKYGTWTSFELDKLSFKRTFLNGLILEISKWMKLVMTKEKWEKGRYWSLDGSNNRTGIILLNVVASIWWCGTSSQTNTSIIFFLTIFCIWTGIAIVLWVKNIKTKLVCLCIKIDWFTWK